MKAIRNTQYLNFVLKEIVKPYQSMISDKERITHFVFNETKHKTAYNYWDLQFAFNSVNWREHVISRLLNIYSGIDFSFFPDDKISNLIQYHLVKNGMKALSIHTVN